MTPWTAAHQASLSFMISRGLLKLMSIESVMPSNHLILCCSFLLLPSVFPSIRVFSSELAGIIFKTCCCCSCSVAQSCPTLCDPMDCSSPGFPVHHQLLKLAQTYVHWVNDAIQPFYPLLPTSPFALNLSQYQGLFKWVSSSHQVTNVLEFQLQQQPFQLIFRTDFL